jgi:hypothetical protein
MIRKSVCFIVVIILLGCVGAWASDGAVLRITGAVEHSLHLTMKDLRKFEPARSRLNEVSQDRRYHGAFRYCGPSMRTLLEFAKIKKNDTDFNKPVDLAVIVKDIHGNSAILSWGEIFYRNPSEIIVAYEATPVIPHHGRSSIPEKYRPYLKQLDRRVGLPKLVVSHDFYSDRSLENISEITVVDLHTPVNTKKQEVLFSPSFMITGDVHTPLDMQKLPETNRLEFTFKEVGDGQGYHGMRHFSGVSLVSLLKKAGIRHDHNVAVVVSAPDGYRTLLSYGELFLSPAGGNIIVGDLINDKRVTKRGSFFLITPDDLSADRHVKAVDKINVVSVGNKPTVYIMGSELTDSGIVDIDLIALMHKAGAFVCPQEIQKRFSSYLGTKPVLFNSCHVQPDNPSRRLKFKTAGGKEVSPDSRAEALEKIAAFLNNGTSIAVIGCDAAWYMDLFDVPEKKVGKDVTVHISHTTPTDETVKKIKHTLAQHHITSGGIVVATESAGIKGYDCVVQSVAHNSDTLACITESGEFSKLESTLRNYYISSTPVFLVYASTYTGKEKLVRTTMADAAARCTQENEKWWKLISAFIGASLTSDKK